MTDAEYADVALDFETVQRLAQIDCELGRCGHRECLAYRTHLDEDVLPEPEPADEDVAEWTPGGPLNDQLNAYLRDLSTMTAGPPEGRG